MQPRRWRRVALYGVLCLLLRPGADWSWGQEPERVGTVVVVEGQAEARKPGQSLWEALHFRDAIAIDDTVRTTIESKAKVLLRDDVIIAVAEQTELQFTQVLLTRQQRRTVAGLRAGMIRVVSGRPPGSEAPVEVRTANAAVNSTNTAFLVRFLPPDTTEVLGLIGVVTVRALSLSAATMVEVRPNFGTRVVGQRSAPTPAVEVSAATRQELSRQVQVIEQLPREVLTSTRLPEVDRQALSNSAPPPPAPPQRGLREATATGPAATGPAAADWTLVPQTNAITPDTVLTAPRVNLRVTFPGR